MKNKKILREEKISFMSKFFPVFWFNLIRLFKKPSIWVFSLIFILLISINRIVISALIQMPGYGDDFFGASLFSATMFIAYLRIGIMLIFIATLVATIIFELFYKQSRFQIFDLEKRAGVKLSSSYFSRVLVAVLILLTNILLLFILELCVAAPFNDLNANWYLTIMIQNYGYFVLTALILLAIGLFLQNIAGPITNMTILIITSLIFGMAPFIEMVYESTKFQDGENEEPEIAQRFTFQIYLNQKVNDFFKKHPDINYLRNDLATISIENYPSLFQRGDFSWVKEDEYSKTKSYEIGKEWAHNLSSRNSDKILFEDICDFLIQSESNKDLKEFIKFIKVIGRKAYMVDWVGQYTDSGILNDFRWDGGDIYGLQKTVILTSNLLKNSMQLSPMNLMSSEEYSKIVNMSYKNKYAQPLNHLSWLLEGKDYNNPQYSQFSNWIVTNPMPSNFAWYKWKIIDINTFDKIRNSNEHLPIKASQNQYEEVIQIEGFYNNPEYELAYFIWMLLPISLTSFGYMIFYYKKRDL
ncbi:hypothetical protein [Spiroplasma alleghenense]|uniref:Uncharacterized protein n=1 Tax=Spiroplasma alleghenense TaxID=216931 RepID=A0A345Z529_9MOLU|nr:hypothetical protein [Spiroplasma alleghenense]AXK51708.1 hypothetical protein SALLE_v1c10380 [Spiroplasma alleghenense]